MRAGPARGSGAVRSFSKTVGGGGKAGRGVQAGAWSSIRGNKILQEDALERGDEVSGGPSEELRVTLPRGLEKAKPREGKQADRRRGGTLKALQAKGGCIL